MIMSSWSDLDLVWIKDVVPGLPGLGLAVLICRG